jgi:splicing factor 3B subunit 3
VNEWSAPQHRSIVAASTNARQVAIALSSGEIVYFEMDEDGSLAEYDDKKEMFGTVTCLSLGEVPEGRVRSSFLAVGCDDCTVRILSLDPESTLENKSVQALTAAPTSLAIIAMEDSSSGGSTLYLHIGLHSGVYLRTVLDEITGELTDTRQKFLGPKAVKLFQVTVHDRTCVLALSSRPWLGYSNPITKSFILTPLSYVDLEWAWNFSSEQCEQGVVGIQGQSLRYTLCLPFPFTRSVSVNDDTMGSYAYKAMRPQYAFLPIVPTEITRHKLEHFVASTLNYLIC